MITSTSDQIPGFLTGERIVVPTRVDTYPGGRSGSPTTWCCSRSRRLSSPRLARGLRCHATSTPMVSVLQNGIEQVEMVQPQCTFSVVPAVVWCPAEAQAGGWVRLRSQPELTLPSALFGRFFSQLPSGRLSHNIPRLGCRVRC